MFPIVLPIQIILLSGGNSIKRIALLSGYVTSFTASEGNMYF